MGVSKETDIGSFRWEFKTTELEAYFPPNLLGVCFTYVGHSADPHGALFGRGPEEQTGHTTQDAPMAGFAHTPDAL